MQLKSMCAKLLVAMLLVSTICGGMLGVPKLKADTNSVFSHFITRSGDTLKDGATDFWFIGANVPTLTMVEDGYWQVPTEWEQRDAFQALKQMGATATRTYVLSVKKKSDYPGMIRHVEGPGKFNEEAFVALDRALALANEYGIRLIIPFVDQYEWWGGIGEYADFREKSKDAFWTDPQLIADFKATISYVLNRVNTITGVPYKDDKAVLAWETGNELTPSSTTWTADIAAHIKSIDANHLVVDGKYGIDDSSLAADSPIDIVSNHYYPNHYDNYAEQVSLDKGRAAGKKAFYVGEFGFIPMSELAPFINNVIESGTSGALIWSLRYHSEDGGFFRHTEGTYEGVFYEAYKWPGFPAGDSFEEAAALALLRDKAYEIRGIADEPALDIPPSPVMLPIDTVSRIGWKGAAGASSYTVERSVYVDGPWQIIGAEVYDAATSDLFDDMTSVTGATYFYRVNAKNAAGASPYSPVMGPVIAKHAISDELIDYSKMYQYATDMTFTTDAPEFYAGDHYRLKLQPNAVNQFVTYALPATPSGSSELRALSLQVTAFRSPGHPASEFTVWTSVDGTNYTELPVAKAESSGTWTKEVYSSDNLPPDAVYYKILFPAGDADSQLGGVELVYNHTSGEELIYKKAVSGTDLLTGILTDEMNNALKMFEHSPNVSFTSDNPQYFGNDLKRLARTANEAESFVYRTAGDMNYFVMTSYARQNPSDYRLGEFTFFSSPDGVTYTPVTGFVKDEVPGEGYWNRTVYTAYTLPANTKYLKTVFPRVPDSHAGETWNPQVGRIQIGVGEEKLEPPVNQRSAVIENFESYSGSNTALNQAYTKNPWGSPLTIALDGVNKSEGNYGMKLTSSLSAGWAGMEKGLANTDWSGNSGIAFWVKPTGGTTGLSIQFNEGMATNGEVWKTDLRISGEEPQLIQLPFSKFYVADWWKSSNPSSGNNRIDLSSIITFSINIDGQGERTLYMDDFRLYKSPVVDTFEGYGGDNTKLQGTYKRNTSGDAITLTLDSEHKQAGEYGLKLDYVLTDTGYAGVSKAMDGADWSAYNGLQLWIKPGERSSGLTLQMKETSGEYWEAKLLTSELTEGIVQIPFGAFQRPSWSSKLNGLLELTSLEEFSIYVDKGAGGIGPGTLYVDSIEAAHVKSIDSFDHYSNSAAVQADYVPNPWGDSIQAALDPNTKQVGKQALKLSYTLTDGIGYAGVTRSLGKANWTQNGNAISFWLKAEHAGHGLTLQLKESDSDIWEAQTIIEGTEARVIQIPFGGFGLNKQWSTGDGKLNLAEIAEYSIFVNKGSGQAGANTLYMDSLAVTQLPVIDNFDYYGGGGDLVAGGIYTTNVWGGPVTFTPDASRKEAGPYGGKYVYELPTASKNFAGVNKKLDHLNWQDADGIRFWMAKDASNRKLTIQFLEANGEAWETYIGLTDSAAGVHRLPFSEFRLAPWSTSGDGKLDLSDITEFSIYVNQGDGAIGAGELYFDTMEVYKNGSTPPPIDPPTNGDSSSSGGGGASEPSVIELQDAIELTVSSLIVRTVTDSSGQAVRQAAIEEDDFKKALELLMNKPAGTPIVLSYDETAVDEVLIPVSVLTDAGKSAASASILKLQNKSGTYSLPLSLLQNPAVHEAMIALGDHAESAMLVVSMTPLAAEDTAKVLEAASQQGAEMLGQPVDFRLTLTGGEKEIELHSFGSLFIEKSLFLGGQTDVSHAAAVVYDAATGSFAYVPASFLQNEQGVEAVITRNGNSVYAIVKHEQSFSDIPAGHWAKKAIDELAGKFLLNGMTETTFAPDRSVTRAEFTMMLTKGLGVVPVREDSHTFTDVRPSDWFAGVVGAASDLSLVNGYEDRSFQPDSMITREQMAVMLDRALSAAGAENPSASILPSFTDAAGISVWAKDAVAAVKAAGLLSGYPDGTFRPQAAATRAEAAVVMQYLIQLVSGEISR